MGWMWQEWGGLSQQHALHQFKGGDKELKQFPYCKRESMYVKSQADSVTIVLPIHMHDSNDPTIAVTFLQEFAGKFFVIR